MVSKKGKFFKLKIDEIYDAYSSKLGYINEKIQLKDDYFIKVFPSNKYIDFETNNLSVSALRRKLVKAKQDDAVPKIVMPVHMAGHSCDMAEIFKLSKEFGFKIIEMITNPVQFKFRKAKRFVIVLNIYDFF